MSFRRGLPGATLFLVSLILISTTVRKKELPASLAEARWFWTIAALFLVGAIWILVRGFMDRNLKSIHCPSCQRDNSGHIHSSVLIASGNCSFCGERVFNEDASVAPQPSLPGALPLQKEYVTNLDRAKDLAHRHLFIALIPILAAVIWFARKATLPTGTEVWHGVVLIGVALLGVVGILFSMEKASAKFGIQCPKCHISPFHPVAAKITLATGHCSKCGTRLFQSPTDPPQGVPTA